MKTENSITISRPIRVGLVGTGYIADFHAKAIRALQGVELAGVADPNMTAAEAFGRAWNVPAYASMDEMVKAQNLAAVHLLVPPDLHSPIALSALEKGLHVLVEKPMCVTDAEAAALVKRSAEVGRLVRVAHSMTFSESFSRLRDHVRNGEVGPIDYLCLNHFLELGTIRFGPFGNWMLRDAGNTLLEIGSHPISGMIELVGTPDKLTVTADRDVILPGGARAYRRWRIQATAGRTAVDINLELGPGFSQRTISARGALGTVIADLDSDTCVLDRGTRSGIDFDRYHRSINQSRQIKQQARHTLADYLLSKIKLRKRGSPYDKWTLNCVAAFYAELRSPHEQDSRITASIGQTVVNTCNRIITAAKLKPNVPARRPAAPAKLKPNILVLGGTGFIGRKLVEGLLASGYKVRAAGRSVSQALNDLGSPGLEVTRTDMRSSADIERALDGIDVVYHLATSNAKTWPQFQEREVEPTRILAEACLKKGIKRLIYTGTIDSYYAGAQAGKITEDTPLDAKITRRNNYAHAKAEIEHMLTGMHRTRGLPLVIARPGIVIGRGGNPFHWGVGHWRSEGVCELWGDGTNMLPLVLVEDVASGLLRCMEKPSIEGRSFNLIDAPLMSARDYVAELEGIVGMKVNLSNRSIWSYYIEDFGKWLVKVAVKHPDAIRKPSYHDWESRTQKAFFDSSRTRQELDWAPASSVEALKSEGIAGSLEGWLAARGRI